MSFDFINPLMLIGLAGIALPILAHLLSKRKFDVVEWGAMQFLELGRNTRRKLQLEELLLLLVRIGLISLLVLALSRPWAAGGLWAQFASSQPRDVVLVVDGSYSMGWEGRAVTPHLAAIDWAHDFLEELRPGDTVALLDARDQVRPVIVPPTHDFAQVRQALNELPAPSGTSHLPAAIAQAVHLLSRTSNLSREVIVLTDGQSLPFSAGDASLWRRIDDLLEQPSVRPRVWAVDVGPDNMGDSPNFSVDRLQLSRELTVPDFPVRMKTKVRCSGGDSTITRNVYLELDGQRLSDKTLSVRLEPNGEASVEFEQRLPTEGSHVLSVVLDDDDLPGDNRSDAAVSIAAALPVLLVDGDPQPDPTRSETFFALAALSASTNRTPWVRATVVAWDRFGADDLAAPVVVALANVPRLTDEQRDALAGFVESGGGLLIAPGDRAAMDAYNQALFQNGRGLAPAALVGIEEAPADDQQAVRVDDVSLTLPWLERFRREHGGGLTEARHSRWWRVNTAAESAPEGSPDANGEASGQPPDVDAPVIAARLESGDAWLVVRRYGRGGVVLLASPLDADWNTLPARPDYVSFLHELIFQLAAHRTTRNIDAGMPLLYEPPENLPLDEYAFFGPGDTEFPLKTVEDDSRRLVRLDDTHLPGVYTFGPKESPNRPAVQTNREHFVVNFDRRESDLAPLDEAARSQLAGDDRLAFVATLDEFKQQAFTGESRSELWHWLLLVFLGILVFEVLMTRRLVKGGHAVVDEEEPSEEPASA